jgi:shikimate kinase
VVITIKTPIGKTMPIISFKTYLEEGVNDPSIFKAVFMAGGPGSGKSFVVGQTALQPLGFKLINTDTAFEKFLKDVKLEATPENIYSPQGQEIRAKAKDLTSKQKKLALKGRLGLVIDGTGKDYSNILQQKQELERLGYDTMMIFVNTDIETAEARNNRRDRSLPADEVKNMWKSVQNNIGKFQKLFKGNMVIVDNSEDQDVKKSTLDAYKDVVKFSKSPIKNPTAKRWIKNNSLL